MVLIDILKWTYLFNKYIFPHLQLALIIILDKSINSIYQVPWVYTHLMDYLSIPSARR